MAQKKSSGKAKPRAGFKKALKKKADNKPGKAKRKAVAAKASAKAVTRPARRTTRVATSATGARAAIESAALDDALAALKPKPPKGDVLMEVPAGGLGLKDAQTSLMGDGTVTQPLTDGDTPLSLPPGAIAALRRSGGLRFTSRQVAVFADGRTQNRNSAYGAIEKPVDGKATDAQIAALKAALTANAFASTGKTTQTPDGYVCEVAGLVNGKAMLTEADERAAPEALKPLIAALKVLLV